MLHLWCSEEPHFVHNRTQVGFPYACQAGSASSQASRSARRMRMVVLLRLLGRVDVLRRMQVGNVVFVQIFVVVFHGASSL